MHAKEMRDDEFSHDVKVKTRLEATVETALLFFIYFFNSNFKIKSTHFRVSPYPGWCHPLSKQKDTF